MENTNISEYDVESVFKFTHPTEYNTFFGRYLITRIHINRDNGTLGILDTNKHPMVYHRVEVEIAKENGKYVSHVSVFSWSKDLAGDAIKLDDITPPQQEDDKFACIIRGFADRIVMIMKKKIPYSLYSSGLADNGNHVVSPEINATGSRTLMWLEKAKVKGVTANSLYFPMFKLDKQRGVFYYSRSVHKQPYVEFSSVDEFKKSEYYIQGDDVAPIVLAQQEECLLEVERQLMGTIN